MLAGVRKKAWPVFLIQLICFSVLVATPTPCSDCCSHNIINVIKSGIPNSFFISSSVWRVWLAHMTLFLFCMIFVLTAYTTKSFQKIKYTVAAASGTLCPFLWKSVDEFRMASLLSCSNLYKLLTDFGVRLIHREKGLQHPSSEHKINAFSLFWAELYSKFSK